MPRKEFGQNERLRLVACISDGETTSQIWRSRVAYLRQASAADLVAMRTRPKCDGKLADERSLPRACWAQQNCSGPPRRGGTAPAFGVTSEVH
jgi:hypothetical protein